MRLNAKKYIRLVCARCHKEFDKELREYTRRTKNGKVDFFCGLGCSREDNSEKSRDEFSPFRLIMFNAKRTAKHKKYQFDLDLPFLKGLWEVQNGRCAYSKIKMTLPASLRVDRQKSLIAASLDRVDSSRGYTQDNVEFVCRFVNLGKNTFSQEEVKDFFKKISMVGVPVGGL